MDVHFKFHPYAFCNYDDGFKDKKVMEGWKKEELEIHKDHRLEVVKYTDGRVYMECIECEEVLFEIGEEGEMEK